MAQRRKSSEDFFRQSENLEKLAKTSTGKRRSDAEYASLIAYQKGYQKQKQAEYSAQRKAQGLSVK